MDKYGRDNLVVILGAPDSDSAELFTETVVNGDPTWAGPLAGEAMHLRVFHIMEPKIKEQIDSKIFEDHLGVMEMALKVDEITQGMNRVRNGNL